MSDLGIFQYAVNQSLHSIGVADKQVYQTLSFFIDSVGIIPDQQIDHS